MTDLSLVDDETSSNDSEELKLEIQFPYFEYSNEMYCDFMMKLMKNLEMRIFNKDYLIASEMDECMEVLFVESGHYKIGYQINN